MRQMKTKEIVDLLAYFTFVSVSKNGEEEIKRIGFTADQMDKMMRVAVHIFGNDESKAEAYIRKQLTALAKKLDTHDDSECQRKNFKGENE